MKLKRPFMRFKLFDRKQDAWLVLPVEAVWAVAAYPSASGEGDTVVLYTEKGDFEIEGSEAKILRTLGWVE